MVDRITRSRYIVPCSLELYLGEAGSGRKRITSLQTRIVTVCRAGRVLTLDASVQCLGMSLFIVSQPLMPPSSPRASYGAVTLPDGTIAKYLARLSCAWSRVVCEGLAQMLCQRKSLEHFPYQLLRRERSEALPGPGGVGDGERDSGDPPCSCCSSSCGAHPCGAACRLEAWSLVLTLHRLLLYHSAPPLSKHLFAKGPDGIGSLILVPLQ